MLGSQLTLSEYVQYGNMCIVEICACRPLLLDCTHLMQIKEVVGFEAIAANHSLTIIHELTLTAAAILASSLSFVLQNLQQYLPHLCIDQYQCQASFMKTEKQYRKAQTVSPGQREAYL